MLLLFSSTNLTYWSSCAYKIVSLVIEMFGHQTCCKFNIMLKASNKSSLVFNILSVPMAYIPKNLLNHLNLNVQITSLAMFVILDMIIIALIMVIWVSFSLCKLVVFCVEFHFSPYLENLPYKKFFFQSFVLYILKRYFGGKKSVFMYNNLYK